jgi:UDP-3-O-[3-hydroxymyristoyl] glucosamine N-acyltransferase
MHGVQSRPLGELARLVAGELTGDPATPIRGLASLERAEPGDLSFVTGPKHRKAAEQSRASALLTPPGLELPGRAIVRVGHPILALSQLLRVFHPEAPTSPGMHPTAVVAESAQVAADAAIMAYVVVGAGSVVESRAVLHPHVVVGPRCRVGEGSVLHPHVVLREDVDVGRRVIIHAGSVLGADGFGYLFDGARHQKIPQVGRVIVEDDVEIGANVAIDRAMLGETVIGRGTKIDNLVQIGHNTVVGVDTIIVAQTGISGSCRVGSRVVLAGQVGVADHVSIGDGAQIGAQSGVHRDVPAGASMLGTPAIPASEARQTLAAVPRLPEVLRTVRRLSRRIDELSRRLDGEGR